MKKSDCKLELKNRPSCCKTIKNRLLCTGKNGKKGALKKFGNFFCILYFLLKESFEIFPGNCRFLPEGIQRNASEALKRIKNISKYKLLAIRAALRDRPLGANLALSTIYFSLISSLFNDFPYS